MFGLKSGNTVASRVIPSYAPSRYTWRLKLLRPAVPVDPSSNRLAWVATPALSWSCPAAAAASSVSSGMVLVIESASLAPTSQSLSGTLRGAGGGRAELGPVKEVRRLQHRLDDQARARLERVDAGIERRRLD